MDGSLTAEGVIGALGLAPHPEGGWYRETFRDAAPAAPAFPASPRGASSAIYFLLRRGEQSAWHRLRDAAEVWHHYAGSPLELAISTDGREVVRVRLGCEMSRGERPQAVVPAGAWQSARPLGDWTLAGCTVAPAFEFERFELAPPGWRPG